jgi:hypothetical protein
MVSTFLAENAGRLSLSDTELSVLSAADIRSFEALDSLVRTFPSIHTLGVRLPQLSAAAMQGSAQGYLAAMSGAFANAVASATSGYGALHPSGAAWAPGSQVPSPPIMAPPSSANAGAAPSASIDLRVQGWPIRDQGQRGTCVAFAAAAAFEHHQFTHSALHDFSEQFLYCAIKSSPSHPYPNKDGATVREAGDTLARDGICLEMDWPYDPNLNPQNISHRTSSDPTVSAVSNARNYSHNHGFYQLFSPGSTGRSSALLRQLQAGKVAVVSLPVFQDVLRPTGPDNWSSPVGLLYGIVLPPVATAIVAGGHAVLITGFVPDPQEGSGGYFIVRNSWGVSWAQQSPSPNSLSPQQGYGQISATYVEDYAWELLTL